MRSSLPLMGIENPSYGRRDPAGRPALITPHGDRKLERLGGTAGHADPLITPHGDRKPSGTSGDDLTRVTSLPLMGIENHDSWNVTLLLLEELITPHGDRKL